MVVGENVMPKLQSDLCGYVFISGKRDALGEELCLTLFFGKCYSFDPYQDNQKKMDRNLQRLSLSIPTLLVMDEVLKAATVL